MFRRSDNSTSLLPPPPTRPSKQHEKPKPFTLLINPLHKLLIMAMLTIAIFKYSHNPDTIGTRGNLNAIEDVISDVDLRVVKDSLTLKDYHDTVAKANVLLKLHKEGTKDAELQHGNTLDDVETHASKAATAQYQHLTPPLTSPNPPSSLPPPPLTPPPPQHPPHPSIPSNATKKKNLTIGMASGIDASQLAVFTASLRLHSSPSSSDCVLFFDVITPRIQTLITNYDIIGITFTPDMLNNKDYHPSTYRWPLIQSYILSNASLYSAIMMADVRDMAFQGDPFTITNNVEGLSVFNGVEHINIGKDGWNGNWVKDCFSIDVFNAVSKSTILCSGISLGDTEAVIKYLELFTGKMESETFKTCERNGVDQGIHNVLVHTGELERNGVKVNKYNQSTGPVCNLQAHVMRVSSNFIVSNSKGEVVPIVHQYDRDEILMTHLFGVYVDWDMHVQTAGVGLCSAYTLRENSEVFKGRCDLSHEGLAANVEDCCRICDAKSGCGGFTFNRNSCWLKTCSLEGWGWKGEASVLTVPGATGGWK